MLLLLAVGVGLGAFISLVVISVTITVTDNVSLDGIIASIRSKLNNALNRVNLVFNFNIVLNHLLTSTNNTRQVTLAVLGCFKGGGLS